MRSHQFNRRTPHNVVGADVRRFGNEFNSVRKAERYLGAKQFSSSKARDLIRYSALQGARSMRFGSALSADSPGAAGGRGGSGAGGRGGARGRGGSAAGGRVSARGSSGAKGNARDSSNAISANSIISTTGSASATGLAGSKRRNNAWFPSKRFLRSVVGMTAGLLLVMNTYTSAVEKRESPQTGDAAVIAQQEGVWNWSEDFTTATFDLSGWGEVPGVVTISEENPPTCTGEGSRTYLATAELGGKTYTDTQMETLPPTGHTFEAGIRTGEGIEFPCAKCGEKVSIGLAIGEEE